MTDAYQELTLIAAALVTLAIAAAHVRGIPRVFLLAQAAYWCLSYIVRPLLLLQVQPPPQYADSLADPRLASMGYDRALAGVLHPVTFGLWVYAGMVVAYALWQSRGRHIPATVGASDSSSFLPTLCVVYVVGLLGRVIAYGTGTAGAAGDLDSPNPFLSFAAQLASIGALGLIVFLRLPNRRSALLVISALLVVELSWTVAVESKTPVLSAALAVAIRFARSGWTRLRLVAVAALSVGAIRAFGWLQAIKQPDHLASAVTAADSSYPPAVRPYLSIIRRFDLLSAATDSYFMGGRPWLTTTEVVDRSLRSLVPAQLLTEEKVQVGTLWATQVRGSSRDMTRVSVSLAEGNINEGFVLGGHLGVVVGVLFTFVLLVLVARALEARHIFFVALGLALSAPPALFERGILGSMEVIGKALQLAVLIWLMDMVIREFQGRTAALPTHPAPVTAPLGTATGARARSEHWH